MRRNDCRCRPWAWARAWSRAWGWIPVLASLSSTAVAGVVLDDPLQGSTKGTRSGGAFAGGGWKVTGKDDSIYWHIPTVSQGALEWDVRSQDLRIDAAGLLQGWTPQAADAGRTFDIEVQAENGFGSDSTAWRVAVVALSEVWFPFDAGAEGWALATWMSGPYDPGTAAWDPAGGTPGGNLRSAGSGDTNNLDTCTREGSAITREVSTEGQSW